MLLHLREEQLIVGQRLLRSEELLDRWLIAYRDLVRPHLLVESYQTPDAGPEELEARLEAVLEREGLRSGAEDPADARAQVDVLILKEIPKRLLSHPGRV